MKIKSLILCSIFMFCFFSCEEVSKLFSETDNAVGLKEALKVGTKNATKILGTEGGYLKDQAVKILLPEQAQATFKAIDVIANNSVVKTAMSALGLNIVDGLENTLVTAFNTAAETAAPAAVDVFVGTITSMTIQDATDILFSSNNKAATDYLHTNSYNGLQTAFSPIVDSTMKTVSVKIGSTDYDALQAWDFFAEYNNKLTGIIADKSVQAAISTASSLNLLNSTQVATIKSVDSVSNNLGNYVVGKALDGIFLKVADEENKIRTDVNARTTDILKDVFGQLDN